MLHNSHPDGQSLQIYFDVHLNTVVAELLDSWQNIDLELSVGGDSHFWTRDTDCELAGVERVVRTMSFVDL